MTVQRLTAQSQRRPTTKIDILQKKTIQNQNSKILTSEGFYPPDVTKTIVSYFLSNNLPRLPNSAGHGTVPLEGPFMILTVEHLLP